MRRWLLVPLSAALVSCGAELGPGVLQPGSVRVEPAATLAVGVGDTVRMRAVVLDAGGHPMSPAGVGWNSADPAVAVVDATGLVTAAGAGTATVSARAGDVSGAGTVEVWVPAVVGAWEAGTSYGGRRGYVEYVPGALPVVVSVPHGGDLEPAEIPDRTDGTTVTDGWTRETALAVRDAFLERTGLAPHLVISHLKRTKLDPNRDLDEAAEGNPFATNAWREFQAFVDTAEAAVVRRYGSGLYIDLHGHGHEILRAELGYLLSSADLALTDDALDAGDAARRSSIRALAETASAPFSELLRGATSLGGLLAADGVAAVPSPADPSPGADPYFTGGYNTARHGSQAQGSRVSGVQIELPNAGTRDTDEHRRDFARALAAAVDAYLRTHAGFFAPSSRPH